jgi:hypothetical protein
MITCVKLVCVWNQINYEFMVHFNESAQEYGENCKTRLLITVQFVTVTCESENMWSYSVID